MNETLGWFLFVIIAWAATIGIVAFTVSEGKDETVKPSSRISVRAKPAPVACEPSTTQHNTGEQAK